MRVRLNGAFWQRSSDRMANDTVHQLTPIERIRDGLAALEPGIPWCHHFELPGGIETVTPAQEPYYTKARGLQKIGRHLVGCIPYHTRKASPETLSVLDLACGEGGHAIEFARAGCDRVVGVEARRLYVGRARFAAACYGLSNVIFERGDVRTWGTRDARFDLVLCLGILHHLSPDDFEPMLARLRALTGDTMMLYTHVDEREGLPPKALASLDKFRGRLSDVIEIPGGYLGRRYLEHPEGMSDAEKERRMRSSIDNNYSFWAKEASLILGLRRAGFRNISRLAHPSPFGEPSREFRVLYVCRV
jgi:SAM-dependent methyltransferase